MALLIPRHFFDNIIDHSKVFDVLIVHGIKTDKHLNPQSGGILFHLGPLTVEDNDLFAHFID